MKLKKQGLYLPDFEHDNCGAGFICSLKGKKSNDIIHKALEILDKLEHRGAVSADGKTGDGAGILIDIPMNFSRKSVPLNFRQPANMPWAIFSFHKKRTKEITVFPFSKRTSRNKASNF